DMLYGVRGRPAVWAKTTVPFSRGSFRLAQTARQTRRNPRNSSKKPKKKCTFKVHLASELAARLPLPAVSAPGSFQTPDHKRFSTLDVAQRLAHVELARAADLVVRIGQHFVPLSDPAYRAGQREDRGEQRGGDADGALHDAR